MLASGWSSRCAAAGVPPRRLMRWDSLAGAAATVCVRNGLLSAYTKIQHDKTSGAGGRHDQGFALTEDQTPVDLIILETVHCNRKPDVKATGYIRS